MLNIVVLLRWSKNVNGKKKLKLLSIASSCVLIIAMACATVREFIQIM